MGEQAVKTAQSTYVPTDADFRLKDNAGEITIDTNFASTELLEGCNHPLFSENQCTCGTAFDYYYYRAGNCRTGNE